MQFIKAGEPADSNIFNKLDERKRRLLASGRDVINLSIGTPDFQPDRHVMEAVSRAALDPEQYKYSLTETRALLDAVQDWYSRRYGDVYKRQYWISVFHVQDRWEPGKQVRQHLWRQPWDTTLGILGF